MDPVRVFAVLSPFMLLVLVVLWSTRGRHYGEPHSPVVRYMFTPGHGLGIITWIECSQCGQEM